MKSVRLWLLRRVAGFFYRLDMRVVNNPSAPADVRELAARNAAEWDELRRSRPSVGAL